MLKQQILAQITTNENQTNIKQNQTTTNEQIIQKKKKEPIIK